MVPQDAPEVRKGKHQASQMTAFANCMELKEAVAEGVALKIVLAMRKTKVSVAEGAANGSR